MLDKRMRDSIIDIINKRETQKITGGELDFGKKISWITFEGTL